jgi:hypothetical protein
MKINYVSLGSFCHPKFIIRDTDREFAASLPFDFNSSPSLTGVTNILKELYEKKTYDLDLKEIICDHNDNELAVSEKNDMYLVHFFKKKDLTENVLTYPKSYKLIKKDVIEDVKQKFKRRFERLYELLNKKNEIICFTRIENYENPNWKYELKELCDVLALYENNNKYIIYSQQLIDDDLHYEKTSQLNYEFKVPIFYYKYYFYDKILIENKEVFIKVLEYFEFLMNSCSNVITVRNKNKYETCEKYLLDFSKNKIFKLTNINNHSDFFLENDLLIINTALYGNQVFLKNKENGIFDEY